MGDSCPSRMLTRKDLLRKELVAGKRADNRQLLEFAPTIISEIKCSNPEDILIIARIGSTRVSCLLCLDIREADPDPDLIHLRVCTLDDAHHKTSMDQEDGDSDDEVEMDDQEDHSSANVEREAALETLIEEFDLIDESRLVLLPGRLVLHLNIAITVLQNSGSIIDAAFLALVAGLERLCLPKVQHDATQETFDYSWDQLHSTGSLLRQRCTCATFAVIGSLLICGPTAEEEQNADAVVLTAVAKSNTFLQVLDGTLPPKFTGKPFEQVMEASSTRQSALEVVLSSPPSEDVLIPENMAVRARSDDLR